MEPLISLIHPSRGRPVKSFWNSRNWISKAGIPAEQIELIVSMDDDDPENAAYTREYSKADLSTTRGISNPNTCVVEAVNHAAAQSTGRILVYLSDDFECPQNWARDIVDLTKEKTLWMLKVDDCLQKFHAEVLTIPIMDRALYQELGYFFHPAYKSMWVDVDLYFTCKKMGVIIEAQQFKFPHFHYCNGKAQKDETYARSDRHMETGRAIYHERRAHNFPRQINFRNE